MINQILISASIIAVVKFMDLNVILKRINIFILTISLCWSGSFALAKDQSSAEAHAMAKESIKYMLSIDRLQFYAQNLADTLDGKARPELVKELRAITAEDVNKFKFNFETLNSSSNWDSIIIQILEQKNHQLNANTSEIKWEYNFFKNKLLERFKIKEDSKLTNSKEIFTLNEPQVVERTVPKIQGSKYLLDVERYIAEKTSRAIMWDAISNDRDFEFHIGNQADFNLNMRSRDVEIVAEILPMARNYNKIYLTYSPKTNRYAYVMNLISGEDRIKHLMAQLRIIRFNNKQYIDGKRDRVQIYGSASKFHTEQEAKLLDIFNHLPKADKVIIGQKGAIDDAIRTAGMLDIISTSKAEVLNNVNLPSPKKMKFENLLEKSTAVSNFILENIKSNPLKLDDVYEKLNEQISRSYKQFTSEQYSHEFSDYLLMDKNGNIKRWRVFSAVWGDEIVPIASALNKSGHKDVVYIGTAGALAGKDIKVGDVIPGTSVITHDEKTLAFEKSSLIETKSNREFVIGQVHTPFDETDVWLKKNNPRIDVVEVETGYLREKLGPSVNLEAYFLISDIVGSETETLAHAAQNSSKRKRGQIKLLENLFVKNGIVSPISNYEMLPNSPAFQVVLNKLKLMRASRDEMSLFQVAAEAIKKGATQEYELEELLKEQPAFDRRSFYLTLSQVAFFLSDLQRRLPKNVKIGIVSEELFNGTYNPKKVTGVKIILNGISDSDLKVIIDNESVKNYLANMQKSFDISFTNNSKDLGIMSSRWVNFRKPTALIELIENEVYKKKSFDFELDKAGLIKLKEIPGLRKQIRCEALFL